MKLRWLGPGTLEYLDGDRARVAYAGDIVNVPKERGELLVEKKLAIANPLQRVDVGYDINHPMPTKAERDVHERDAQETHDRTQTILREARLRPHSEIGIVLERVPVEGGD